MAYTPALPRDFLSSLMGVHRLPVHLAKGYLRNSEASEPGWWRILHYPDNCCVTLDLRACIGSAMRRAMACSATSFGAESFDNVMLRSREVWFATVRFTA
jgi:hypothetical protein